MINIRLYRVSWMIWWWLKYYLKYTSIMKAQCLPDHAIGNYNSMSSATAWQYSHLFTNISTVPILQLLYNCQVNLQQFARHLYMDVQCVCVCVCYYVLIYTRQDQYVNNGNIINVQNVSHLESTFWPCSEITLLIKYL